MDLPRRHRDPCGWLMNIADDRPVYFRDLPWKIRQEGIAKLMRMVSDGSFPRYHQISKGGKRFWSGRSIKAHLSAHPELLSTVPDSVAQDCGEELP
jgi:hypothetical protein